MEELLTVVEIQLGIDHYLIDGDIIDKFILPLPATAVYDAPAYIEGMVSWKDETILAINIAPLLGMSRDENATKRRTMIIPPGKVSEAAMAVSVDQVYQVRKIRPVDVMPVDISSCKGIEDYVKGIIRVREDDGGEEVQLVLLYLNLEKMMRELLKGRVSEPVPGFFVWRWETEARQGDGGSCSGPLPSGT